MFSISAVANKMSEILTLYDTASEFNTPNIIALVNRAVNETQIAKDLDNFMNRHMPLRAIADPKLREDMRRRGRLSKNAGSVYFSEFEADMKGWADCPHSIRYYVRLNEEPAVDLEHYRGMIVRFLELGMDSQANACVNHMQAVTKKRDKYCGFQKVDVDSLVGTLGKVHGFVSNGTSVSLSVDTNPEMMKFLLSHICFSPSTLKEMMEWVDETWVVSDPSTLLEALDCTDNYDDWEDLVRVFSKKRSFSFYRARVYTTSNPIVSKLLPIDVFGIIDQLERFHDFGYLPLFDHFLLMVPSIAITDIFYNEKNKGYFIYDGKMVRDFERKEDASVFLDFMMMKHRVVYPLLVGQKDDQQYPIGYCI
jgi:hypothetical protein